ncbi:hypothetical protein KKE45_04020, partial [Patescibacteria group bacterium]|nr:hypothetical protein [Patescibacteria group bacterium]
SDYFLNSTNLAKYLCVKNEMKEEDYRTYESEALQLFNTYRNLKVRDIIKNKKELKALASYSANSLDFQKTNIEKALKKNIKSNEKSLEELKSRIEQTERLINSATNNSTYNALVDNHNELINKYETIRTRYNEAIEKYNSLDNQIHFVVEIGGGINLESRNFKIKTTQNSSRLQAFQKITDKVGSEWKTVDGFGKWIKYESKAGSAEVKIRIPRIEWAPEKESAAGNLIYKHIQGYPAHQYWLEIESPSGSWRDCRKMDMANYRERAYEAESKKLQVAEFRSGKLKDFIIGQMDSAGRIVFRRSERKNILKPQEPPVWFQGN